MLRPLAFVVSILLQNLASVECGFEQLQRLDANTIRVAGRIYKVVDSNESILDVPAEITPSSGSIFYVYVGW